MTEARARRFLQVDVFSRTPCLGNALAVVADADGLTDEKMQLFARWTNLSETTFLLPPSLPEADYKVRIFTPGRELPFAGHPTLGSCFVWLQKTPKVELNKDVIIQECGVGLVKIKRTQDRLAFSAPRLIRSGPLDDELKNSVCEFLGIDPSEVVDAEWVDNGPGWLGVLLRNAEAVMNIKPTGRGGYFAVGVVGFYPQGSEFLYEVRTFYPENGIIVEDPVTGSFNASAAQWLRKAGKTPSSYIASQGTKIGRSGRIYIDWNEEEEEIWVGGDCVTCIEGTLIL